MISIIVPIYNIEKYLDKCIESICNQTYRNLQIILVNDGSTDGSDSIIARWAQKDKRICVIRKNNGGLVSARKAGISEAGGLYSICIDGDDWIEEDFVKRMLHEIEVGCADIILPGYIIDNKEHRYIVYNSIQEGIYKKKDLIPIMLCNDLFYEFGVIQYACSKMFRTDILKECQMKVPDDISLGEDVAVTYACLLCADTIKIVKYAGYHYVQRNDSISNKRNNNAEEKCDVLISYLKDTFKLYGVWSDLAFQLNQYAKLIYLSSAIDRLDDNDVILKPFGGIEKKCKIVLYGAGAIGKSVKNYLEKYKEVMVVAWVDRNSALYDECSYSVISPDLLNYKAEAIDYIIICISNYKTIKKVKKYLEEQIGNKTEIKALTYDFMDKRNDWGLL